MVIIEPKLCSYETLHTFTRTGYDTWKELAGEMVALLTAVSLTSVPEVILAFFLAGAVAVVVFMVLGFNTWPFWFLTSGIVFDGSMLAI